MRWEVPQTIDTIDPLSAHYNPKSAYAKTLRRDGKTWGGGVPAEPAERRMKLAHDNSAMDCQICHTSWATSCFGCHLPMKANQRVPQNKFEGVMDRNYTTYNPAGGARRRLHARDRRHGEEEPHGGVAFLERGRGRFAKRESRMGLLAGANRLRGRLQRAGFQSAFPAHHQQRRHDEELHRLPSLEEQRQQRLDDAAARLRHRHGEFLRALRLRRRRARRIARRDLDRSGGTAGRDRQPPAQARLPGQLPKAPRGRFDSERSARAQRSRHSGPRLARRISLHRERTRRLRGLRRGEHRPERIFGTDRERAGFSARPAHPREYEIRHLDRAAEHARARSRAGAPAGKRRAADRYVLRLRLCLGSRGRPGRLERGDAGRRQSGQQFPEARRAPSIPTAS